MNAFQKMMKRTLPPDDGDSETDNKHLTTTTDNKRPKVMDSSILRPDDLSKSPGDALSQPKLSRFPDSNFGERQRRFAASYYKSAKGPDWLEYSQGRDACFCFPCFHFPSKTTANNWTVVGFRAWNNLAIGVANHCNSLAHIGSCIDWQNWKNNQSTGDSVAAQLNSAHSSIAKANREYIRSIAEVVHLCACQGIALRGHREDPNQTNRGNFLEILTLLSIHDAAIANKLTDKANATYTHHSVQNELLSIEAGITRAKFSDEVEAAGMYALMVDESKDISKQEQIAIVLRYINDLEPTEVLLDIVAAEGLDAYSLCCKIKSTLTKYSIPVTNCVAQCYDGASVMSGASSGVQARFRSDGCNGPASPHAYYTHCFNHRLNLALCDAIRNANGMNDTLNILNEVYIFVSSSVVHSHFKNEQKAMVAEGKQDGSGQFEIQRRADTRWTSSYGCVHNSLKALAAIMNTVDFFACSSDRTRSTNAKALQLQIDTQCIVRLCILEKVLSITRHLSDTLQKEDIDYGDAVDLVESTKLALNQLVLDTEDTNSEWKQIWARSKTLCQIADVPEPLVRRRRQVRADANENSCLGTEDEYKKHVLRPITDSMISELNNRFGESTSAMYLGVAALTPKSKYFLANKELVAFGELYNIKKDDICSELTVLKRMTERNPLEASTLTAFLGWLDSFRGPFFSIHQLTMIATTLPCSSAGCERSFSCLRRVKNYLRSTMLTDRLGDLCVISCNADRASKIDLNEIVEKFAEKPRRFVL